MGLIKHFKEAKEARKAQKAAEKAREAEFPPMMTTMTFKSQVILPYLSSINPYGGLVPPDDECEREVKLPTTMLNQYEARKIVTAVGDRYQVYNVVKLWPNSRPEKVSDESAKLPNNDGTVIFTKEQAVNYLKQLEQEDLKTKDVYEDGAKTKRHVAQYLPKP